MNFSEQHTLETYKSMIKMSLEGLKTIFLINAGAIVAMLAYLEQSSQGPIAAQHAWIPLSWFIGGVISCVGSFVGAYTTQFFLLNESLGRHKSTGHMTVLWLTVGLVLTSLVCFACGSYSSVKVISAYGITTSAKTSSCPSK